MLSEPVNQTIYFSHLHKRQRNFCQNQHLDLPACLFQIVVWWNSPCLTGFSLPLLLKNYVHWVLFSGYKSSIYSLKHTGNSEEESGSVASISPQLPSEGGFSFCLLTVGLRLLWFFILSTLPDSSPFLILFLNFSSEYSVISNCVCIRKGI